MVQSTTSEVNTASAIPVYAIAHKLVKCIGIISTLPVVEPIESFSQRSDHQLAES